MLAHKLSINIGQSYGEVYHQVTPTQDERPNEREETWDSQNKSEERDIRDLRDTRDTHDIRDLRDTRDIRDFRDTRDTRDTRDIRDTRDTRDIRDTRDLRDTRDTLRNIQDFQESCPEEIMFPGGRTVSDVLRPWPDMREHVKKFVRRCACCQKMSHIKVPITTHKFTRTAPSPFMRINIDRIGPLPESAEGYTHILVIIDCFTR